MTYYIKQSCTLLHLVLEHGPSKGPDGSKDEVELVDLLGGVWWGVLRAEQGLQQVAQGLNHADVSDRRYLGSECFS